MNLHVAGVSKVGALTIALYSGCTVAAHGVSREEVSVTITTGGYNHGVGREALELAGNEVLGDDTAGVTVDDNKVFHLVTGVELDAALVYLTAQRRVGTQQKLLAGLTLSVEGTRNLSATKRAVGQHATVLAGERNTLGHALVNDIVRHLSQTVDVGLAGAVVATLHGVIEKTVYRVAVVLVVLSSVDTALCSDRVGTARRVLDAEVEHVETHLAERSSCAGASQTSTYDDDVKFKFILGVYQALMSLVVGPLLSYGTLRYSGI